MFLSHFVIVRNELKEFFPKTCNLTHPYNQAQKNTRNISMISWINKKLNHQCPDKQPVIEYPSSKINVKSGVWLTNRIYETKPMKLICLIWITFGDGLQIFKDNSHAFLFIEETQHQKVISNKFAIYKILTLLSVISSWNPFEIWRGCARKRKVL